MTVPNWIQDAIFYQIFPDRFAKSGTNHAQPHFQPWGTEPTTRGFQGGNLRGVIEKFDYLLDLGINALYFTPIFQSAANHRYHPNDYYKIDHILGSNEDFKALLEAAHANGVKVVVDGVFNHTGRGFFAFNSILEVEDQSPYKDWYRVKKFPLEAFSEGKAENFEAWWDMKELPEFNTDNPEVRRYIMEVARYWIEQGIDGWRLDVPGEIDDDAFWGEFRAVVKTANPDAYILGEIWEADPRWVGDGHFDGLMNYPVREAVLDFLNGKINADKFAHQVESLFDVYQRQHLYAMYVPLGSHDVPRMRTELGGDLDKVKLAFLYQFAYPGAPAIYYGDEIGMEGGKDPQNRRAFPWDQEQWDHDLRAWVQKLIAIRKRTPVLRRGDYARLKTHNDDVCYAFARTLGEEKVVVVMNASGQEHEVHPAVQSIGWTDGQVVKDLLTNREYTVSGEKVSLKLPAHSGVWLSA